VDNQKYASLVLPLIDENKPKCYLCHEMFENMEDLKKHQESRHKEFFDKYEKYNTEN
jgi:quinol monooxygenase YgiN